MSGPDRPAPPDLVLRRARPDDAAAVLAIMTHPEVQPGLMQLPHGSELRWREILEANDKPGSQDLMLLATLRDDAGNAQVVGSAGLHPAGAQIRRRHAAMLGISVLPIAQGRGVADALMRELIRYADRWAGILRIELTVFADNQRAIELYERHGFRHEGRHVGYAMRDGQYVDALCMARLHPNPPTWNVAP